MNYIYNIEGCLQRYGDVKVAHQWLDIASKKLSKDDFDLLLQQVHSVLLSVASRDFVSEVYTILSAFNPILGNRFRKEFEAELLLCQERERQRIEEERLIRQRRQEKDTRREAERREQIQQEEMRREAEEKARLEQIAKEARRGELFKELKKWLDKDFIAADTFFKSSCAHLISNEDYEKEKTSFVQTWIKSETETKLDNEQAAAIATINGHVQVVARAGSGKTTTLVNRALFLQKHCGISPSEILLLAFNRKAAEEIRERLATHLKSVIPHIMTFHALAYALVHPEECILFDEPEGEQSKSRAIQDNLIDEYFKTLDIEGDEYQKFRCLMLAHFREDWEQIILRGYNKSPDELLQYRRSLPKEGIDGKYYKSSGEKVIADFLFEHDINYEYEHNFWWNGINYRPDFMIRDKGIVIEYFGLKGDIDYDAMADEKRKYWQNKSNWHLLELFPDYLKNQDRDGFCALLKHSLEDCGIPCNRLSEEEIGQRIKSRAIDRFTKAVEEFIQHCRKLSLTPIELGDKIARHTCISDVEHSFLDIAQTFYASYLGHLQQTGKDDFDGLMQKAAKIVASGKTEFIRKSGKGDLKQLRYILIDEYQDFSELFHRLIASIREQNPHAQFFCVGDDWQAINGFAGSDLRFYQNFTQFFQPACKLNVSINYRSATSIVDISNVLMQGLGTPAHAYKHEKGMVEIVDLETFEPTSREKGAHSKDSITPAVLRLVSKVIMHGKDVVLLSRKNSLPWYVNYGKRQNKLGSDALGRFLEQVRTHLPETLRHKVTISTTHKYKGLQKEVIIVLDAIPRCYPLIHPNWVFTRIFDVDIKKIIDDERRLFYVALTRAVDHLFIITEPNKASPFLEELKSRKLIIPSLNWSDYPDLVSSIKYVTVKVRNQARLSRGTYAIKDLLRIGGYEWDKKERIWWRIYPALDFTVGDFLAKSEWVSMADGIEVRFYDHIEQELAIYHVNKGQVACIKTAFATEIS